MRWGLGFRIQGLGFGAWGSLEFRGWGWGLGFIGNQGLGFEAWGSEFGVWGLRLKVYNSGIKVQCLESRVEGLGLRA